MLNDICENLDDLVIVCNGFLNNDSISKLKKYSNHDILFRDNIGFDAGAWRDAMLNIGFDKFNDFDEIIFFNDSFFGPFYPFKIIFDKMQNENVDYWGITSKGDSKNSNYLCPYEICPEHIQTYFFAVRKNLFQSTEFQNYWKNLPNFPNLNHLKYKFEAVFTRFFEDLGYKWGVYIDSEEFVEKNDIFMDLTIYEAYNCIVNQQLPILKIKGFKIPKEHHLLYNNAVDLSKSIDYLKNNTDYDVSLIFSHLLRKLDPNQLAETLNLVKIFPKNQVSMNDYKTEKNVILVAHLYYDDLWEYAFNYFKNIPEYIDILITTDSDDKKTFFEENISKNLKNDCTVMKINARGRDLASLLVASRNIIRYYDYFCFIHDKSYKSTDYATESANFRDILWENNLASVSYINNIIKEFDSNSSLGLVVPPRVYHGNYFYPYINNYWNDNFEVVLKLLDKMNIKTPINKNYSPMSIGTCFWAKYDALKPLFDLNLDYEDFPKEPLPVDGTISHALERIFGYVAASRKYYSEFIITEDYARGNIFNFNFMMDHTFHGVKSGISNPRSLATFLTFKNSLNNIFATKRRELINKNNLIKNQENQINNLNSENNNLNNEIKTIKSTVSWRVTKPLRWIRNLF